MRGSLSVSAESGESLGLPDLLWVKREFEFTGSPLSQERVWVYWISSESNESEFVYLFWVRHESEFTGFLLWAMWVFVSFDLGESIICLCWVKGKLEFTESDMSLILDFFWVWNQIRASLSISCKSDRRESEFTGFPPSQMRAIVWLLWARWAFLSFELGESL